jgi:3-hydroxyacyl-[acyl-carrier-protein] dehydratase
VRFIFVDRLVEVVAGKSIFTVKNVAASEDYFADHFPRMPIMPGALILECMIQSAMLMLGAPSDFRSQPAVKRIRRAGFRHVVRPGDRLTVRCAADDGWVVHATAAVDDRTVATAIIEFERGPALPADNPLRSLHEALRMDPDELAARVGAA